LLYRLSRNRMATTKEDKKMSPRRNSVATIALTLGLSVLSPPLAAAAAREPEAGQGPRIVLVAPQEGSVCTGPVDIEVRFEPQGAPIDLSTLEVKYMKFFAIDITRRVLPYATAEGIRFSGIDLARGTHEVEISVADTSRHVASRTLSITVR
jgi:hypothetical protein